MEPGLPVSEYSTRILKLYVTTDSEHKLYKMGIGNLLTIGFNLGSSLLGTRSHNTTLCSNANGEGLKILHKILE